jgi:hypothetical protein
VSDEKQYWTASTLNSSWDIPKDFNAIQMLKDAHKRVADSIIQESFRLTEMNLWKGFAFRNPFDFMTETDQWFEWKWRTMYGKEKTFDVINDMVKDKTRIAKCVEVSFTISYHWNGPSFSVPSFIYPTA